MNFLKRFYKVSQGRKQSQPSEQQGHPQQSEEGGQGNGREQSNQNWQGCLLTQAFELLDAGYFHAAALTGRCQLHKILRVAAKEAGGFGDGFDPLHMVKPIKRLHSADILDSHTLEAAERQLRAPRMAMRGEPLTAQRVRKFLKFVRHVTLQVKQRHDAEFRSLFGDDSQERNYRGDGILRGVANGSGHSNGNGHASRLTAQSRFQEVR